MSTVPNTSNKYCSVSNSLKKGAELYVCPSNSDLSICTRQFVVSSFCVFGVITSEEIVVLRDLASDVIKNHHKLLQIEVYGLWFEVESQKRAIQILKE